MSIRPSDQVPVQDMAPPGGFRKVFYGQQLVPRGPKGWQLWVGSALIISYGFYKVGQTNTEKQQQKMQERRVRYALAPLLQAEADREYLERELINLRKEAEIMKNHPDWEVGKNPYNTGVFMPRAVADFARSLK